MTKLNNTLSKLNARIIFWGTPQFAVPSLQAIKNLEVNDLKIIQAVITQPSRPAGRGKKLRSDAVLEYCQDNSIKYLTPDKLNQDFITELKTLLPATFVIVAYGKIIPQNILDLSELPALNIHPSKLPVLRGPSPIQTALLKGFVNTAVSLMQLDEKMDHGPILEQIKVEIGLNQDYLELSNYLSGIGANLLKNNIMDYLNNQLIPLPQDDSKATFCHLIKKTDGQIDWQKSAQDIHNQVRAFCLWPKAFTKIDNLELKILKTKVVVEKLNPGEIKFDKSNLIVGTSNDSLKILELQPANKKKLMAADFIRGYSQYLNKTFN